jgi:hypothetical protein
MPHYDMEHSTAANSLDYLVFIYALAARATAATLCYARKID